MVLLDRRSHWAADTDSIAAHLQRLRLARSVEKGRIHRLAVLRAECKDLSRLDAAADMKMPASADRALIALHYETDICNRHLTEVTLRIDI